MDKKFYIIRFDGGYIIRTNTIDPNYLSNELGSNYDYDVYIAKKLKMELDQYKQYIYANCKNFHKSLFGTIFGSKDEADSILEWIESIYEVMDALAGNDHFEFDNSEVGTSYKLCNTIDYAFILGKPLFDRTLDVNDIKITNVKQRDIKNRKISTTNLTYFIKGE
jgi:hypothetical protein